VTKSDAPPLNVTKPVTKRKKSSTAMNLALKILPTESDIAVRSVDDRIRAFLSGETNGEDVLGEIYDHVLEEPIPDRLRAVLRR